MSSDSVNPLVYVHRSLSDPDLLLCKHLVCGGKGMGSCMAQNGAAVELSMPYNFRNAAEPKRGWTAGSLAPGNSTFAFNTAGSASTHPNTPCYVTHRAR